MFDIGLSSDLWKSSEERMRLIRGFYSFIMRNRINLLTKIEVLPFTSDAMVAP